MGKKQIPTFTEAQLNTALKGLQESILPKEVDPVDISGLPIEALLKPKEDHNKAILQAGITQTGGPTKEAGVDTITGQTALQKKRLEDIFSGGGMLPLAPHLLPEVDQPGTFGGGGLTGAISEYFGSEPTFTKNFSNQQLQQILPPAVESALTAPAGGKPYEQLSEQEKDAILGVADQTWDFALQRAGYFEAGAAKNPKMITPLLKQKMGGLYPIAMKIVKEKKLIKEANDALSKGASMEDVQAEFQRLMAEE